MSTDPERTRTYPRTNLVTCTPQAFKDCLDFAFDMGRRDEINGWPERTGSTLADILTTSRRGGHERALRAAYMAARFHIRAMS